MEIIENSLKKLGNVYAKLDDISLHNQRKVLDAFVDNRVSLRHFNGTTGYGYDDVGRDTLCKVVAQVFGAEDAVVSPQIVSGTHAITLALFGVLRPNDIVLSICGEPYDTLQGVIKGQNIGSLADFGVKFNNVPLTQNNEFDYDAIQNAMQTLHPKMVYIQRSRGYAWRSAFCISQIQKACDFVKKIDSNVIIFCDNCYGEFVEKQ